MKYFFTLIGVVIFLWYYDYKNPIPETEIENESRIIFGRYGINKIKEKYGNIINDASEEYGVNSNIVLAIIKQESGGNPNAIGPKGEIGLMQLMPGTARDMGVNNPFNPRDNIFGGTKYLRYLLDIHNGDLDKAVMSYNIGPNGQNVYRGYRYLKGIKSGLVF